MRRPARDLNVHELTIGARGSAREWRGTPLGHRQKFSSSATSRAGDQATVTQDRLESGDRRGLHERDRSRLAARRTSVFTATPTCVPGGGSACAAARARTFSRTTSSTTAPPRPSRIPRQATPDQTRAASRSKTQGAPASPTRSPRRRAPPFCRAPPSWSGPFSRRDVVGELRQWDPIGRP